MAAVLRRVWFLATNAGYTLDMQSNEQQVYQSKDIVYSPFTNLKRVFLIAEGYVTASTIDDDGKHRIHLIYGPGAYFPVLSVFRGTPQRATYTALTTTAINCETTESFMARLDDDEVFCRTILNKTVDQLALFAERVIDLQLTKLTDRIERKVQVLAKDHGVHTKHGLELPYLLRHHHIADMLGVERESVSRALATLLRSKRLTVLKDGRLCIVES